MKILVTGGAGYIGSHACKALKEKGYGVVVFDNLVYGHRAFVKWGEFVEGDLMERAQIDLAIKKFRPDAIMHFAAFAYVGESVADPSKYYNNNVVGTLNLLDSARENGVDKIVFSSTCAVYGVPKTVPISEDHPREPISPYGRTKAVIEDMLKDYGSAYGLKSVSLRYFNAAGADHEIEIGEDHEPETHLIPLVLDAASGRRPGVTVYGSDYDTSDGTCIRDYVHVTDIADAHVKALEYLVNGGQSAAFNLGNEKGYSVKEVCEAARRITGKDFSVAYGERRPGDPPCLIGSSTKAKKILGWRPLYGGIEVIIEHAWKWHEKRFCDQLRR